MERFIYNEIECLEIVEADEVVVLEDIVGSNVHVQLI